MTIACRLPRSIARFFTRSLVTPIETPAPQGSTNVPTARDVAQYALEQHGSMTSMKLQKLVYYSQAWHIVWDDDVLFDDPIEAWKNGPVVRDLWEANRHQFRVTAVPGGDSCRLDADQKATVNEVIAFYGKHDAQWLSDLTHMEDPWKTAFARGQNTPIPPRELGEYYASIAPDVA